MFNKGSQGCYRGSSLLDKIPQPKNVIEFNENNRTVVVKLSAQTLKNGNTFELKLGDHTIQIEIQK